jgi:hypothetical protein
MSNDNYSAPVYPARQEMLKRQTTELNERMNRFLHHPCDSIELSGLAEELEGLAANFRAARDRSVEEHQDPELHKYRVLVNSVQMFECEIECTDAERMAVARDTDGGIFTEIGEGTWSIESVERVE